MRAANSPTPFDLREFFGEGISDSQITEYREYASRIRQIEHSDFVAREWQYHLAAVGDFGKWLADEIEGADIVGEMLAHHRRCAMLCEREIDRRKQANKFPPYAGLVFRDFKRERDELQARAAEIISSYTPLKKTGKEFSGLCIFHNDQKHPSLRVNADKGLWYCFTCGVGGDVLDFVARAEGKK